MCDAAGYNASGTHKCRRVRPPQRRRARMMTRAGTRSAARHTGHVRTDRSLNHRSIVARIADASR
eukprot:6910055-Pyramimonas_sp.AAC.1